MSDSAITVITGAVVTIALAYIAYRTKRIEATGEKTHSLVNSRMGAQLKLTAIATRRLAEIYPDNKVDVEAARLAKEILEDHELKQAMVDSEYTRTHKL